MVFLRAQNRAFRCFPSCKKPCSRSCFLVLSLVHKNIVLFGALPRAQNRAFWCSPSCTKIRAFWWCSPSCQKPALYRAFWCSPSCQKSCFLVLSFVHCSLLSKHRALDRVFCALLRAKNRGFCCCPSCEKLSFPQTVYCRGSQFFLKRCPPLCYWPCPPLWASRFICLPSHVSFWVVVSVAASIPGSSTGTWTVLECI